MVDLPLTIVFIQDPTDKGYTVFAKQIPNIIAEGDNEDSALENLLNTMYDAFKYANENIFEGDLKSNPNVFEKVITLKYNT